MAMALRHSEPTDGVPLEVELDQHDRLAPDHPAVMPWLDGDDLRSFVLDDAAVGIFDMDLAADEKPDVRMHAEVGADGWLHVD